MKGGVHENCEIDVGEGLLLHLEISGEGPPVVLLHGFTGSTETWKRVYPGLAEFHAVVLVDLPGHGQSSAPSHAARYGLERFADDLALALDRIGFGRVALLGYSMGARAALKFAIAHPERLAGLVLESASPGVSTAALRAQRQASDRELADSIEQNGVPAFVDHWESLSLWASQRNLSLKARASLRAQRLAGSAVGLANSLRGAGAGIDPPVHSKLHEITAPTLLIAGALDSQYVHNARLLAEAIPHARISIISDAGHAVHLEQPAALSSEVGGFLRDLPRSPRTWL